ncbi:MAG: heme-binding protein [Methylotenera sp.]|jgi:hypothetical protein|nr:heme-binding protein [Methylotenera sp.]
MIQINLRKIFGLILLIFTVNAMATTEPKFDLLEKSDGFELRQYHPMIIAEVLVEGDMEQASNKGFRLIADYIFGNNQRKSGQSAKIAMTAPVTLQPKSEKIAMTAPVTLASEAGKWRVNFVMPAQYTMDTLPSPNNSQVMLRQIPVRKVAVLRFSGLVNAEKTAQKTKELLTWMAGKKLEASSAEPELARYNPPWTLPFLRRNEIMIQYE